MDNLSGKMSIDTPENIFIDAEIAGFGTRCIAAIIDYMILLVVIFFITLLFSGAISGEEEGRSTVIALYALVQFGVVTFYHLLFEVLWNGQTPGKRRTNIRVVQTNGLPLSTSGALIRNLVRLFDFLPLLYGVGLASLFITKHTQRLGDLAAKTVVIRERRNLTVSTLKENLSAHYLHLKPIDSLPDYIHADRLTLDDRRTVVDYLQRRFDLRNPESIARMLAQNMARKMGYGLEQADFLSLNQCDLFLEQIARAFELAEKTGD